MVREIKTEELLKKEVEFYGGYCLKLPSNVYTGIPDRLVILPGGLVFFCELKRVDTKVVNDSAQGMWRDNLRKLGMLYAEINGNPGVDRFIQIVMKIAPCLPSQCSYVLLRMYSGYELRVNPDHHAMSESRYVLGGVETVSSHVVSSLVRKNLIMLSSQEKPLMELCI